MRSLNFAFDTERVLLRGLRKYSTVRLGDLSGQYTPGDIVYVTMGRSYEKKRSLYPAYIDQLIVKTLCLLTSEELMGENPAFKNVDEFIDWYRQVNQKEITPLDFVTVIFFSEILD
jgi:hypothetical protein